MILVKTNIVSIRFTAESRCPDTLKVAVKFCSSAHMREKLI